VHLSHLAQQYLPACNARVPNACSGARHLELYADEVAEEPNKNILRSIFWEGDTQGDAFLTAAAAQVKVELTAAVQGTISQNCSQPLRSHTDLHIMFC